MTIFSNKDEGACFEATKPMLVLLKCAHVEIYFKQKYCLQYSYVLSFPGRNVGLPKLWIKPKLALLRLEQSRTSLMPSYSTQRKTLEYSTFSQTGWYYGTERLLPGNI